MNESDEMKISNPQPLSVDSPEIVYQQDKAAIDTQITTAKAYPRNITKAVDDATAVVTMDDETAASCTYALPRGGKTISGPSVHLARILLQMWKNLRAEAKVVSIDMKHVTSQAIVFDLENNVAVKVEVKRSIVGKKGRFNDDMITVTGNAGNAIALRNAVFAVIPKAVTDKVWKAAKRRIVGDLSSDDKLIASRKKIFDEFRDSLGVAEKELLELIGKPSITNLSPDDLAILMGVRQAILDGDTTVQETFRKGKPKAGKDGKTKEDKVTEAVKNGMSKVKSNKDK